jgi:hypothetical protein
VWSYSVRIQGTSSRLERQDDLSGSGESEVLGREMSLAFFVDRAMVADGAVLKAMEEAFPPGPFLFFGDMLELQPFRAKHFFPNFRIAYAHNQPLDANPALKAYQN